MAAQAIGFLALLLSCTAPGVAGASSPLKACITIEHADAAYGLGGEAGGWPATPSAMACREACQHEASCVVWCWHGAQDGEEWKHRVDAVLVPSVAAIESFRESPVRAMSDDDFWFSWWYYFGELRYGENFDGFGYFWFYMLVLVVVSACTGPLAGHSAAKGVVRGVMVNCVLEICEWLILDRLLYYLAWGKSMLSQYGWGQWFFTEPVWFGIRLPQIYFSHLAYNQNASSAAGWVIILSIAGLALSVLTSLTWNSGSLIGMVSVLLPRDVPGAVAGFLLQRELSPAGGGAQPNVELPWQSAPAPMEYTGGYGGQQAPSAPLGAMPPAFVAAPPVPSPTPSAQAVGTVSGYCQACFAPVQPNATFCPNCGAKL